MIGVAIAVVGTTLVGGLILLSSLREIRPTERGLKEQFGAYKSFMRPGWHIVLPVIQNGIRVDVTENMVDAERQEVITEDNLNCHVDAQVYFKVKLDEESVKASQYNVQDYKYQIVQLARTTLRDIIGSMTLKKINSQRNEINKQLMDALIKETKSWGIEVVRTELKEIEPPEQVQVTMNQIVMAENKKIASTDLAKAKVIEADGEKEAQIKKAEGEQRSRVLKAEGKAQAIKLENEAAHKYFVGNAQTLKKLEVTAETLKDNTKFVLPKDGQLINVIGEASGVLPIKK